MRQDSKAELQRINQHIERLPLLPAVLFELMRHDKNDEKYYEKVLELSRADPPLASFIIGYANSAGSAPNKHITDIKVALTRVGAHRIVNLLTAKSIAKVFVPNSDEFKILWQHSIEVAVISSFVCRLMSDFELDPETAYIAGLMHDIGRFTMFSIIPDSFKEIEEQGWSDPDELYGSESESLGFSHAEVGYLASKKLKLPELLCNAIRYHHNHKVWGSNIAMLLQELVIIIQFSDCLSILIEKNPNWIKWSDKELQENIVSHCIRPEFAGVNFPVATLSDALPSLMKNSQHLLESICAV